MRRLVTVEREDPDADVLVVTNSWPHPADQRYGIFVKRQVDSLIEAGLHCDVLFVRGFESPLAYAVAAARLLRLSVGRPRRYRLVHGHGGETLLPCLLFVRGRRVISFCGDDLLGTPGADGALLPASRVKRVALRQLSRLTSATVTKSSEMDAVLPQAVRQRNIVLPNGVDRDAFRPMDRALARRELGWEIDEHVALYAADPELPRKRYPLAVAACEHARRAGVPVRLHIAHTTPPGSMPTVMNAADCLLMTSAIEGSPNVVKEAVAVGLPVVTVPVGDVREVLDDVHPSYVCEPDPQALGEAIAACIRSGRRSDGRERSEWLDQRRIAERLLDLYEARL
jgi:glycosyltransferase involved in cell wall biosynthesis